MNANATDQTSRLQRITSLTISGLLILYCLIMLCRGIQLGFIINEWNLTEFLINFEGGFVRRGLLGQLLFELCSHTGWSPVWLPNIFCHLVYLAVITFFFVKFRQQQLNWWILLCPIMFGMALDIVRKDYLLYLMSIAMFYLIGKREITVSRYICVMLTIILGLFIHEAFIFFGIPLVILMIWRHGQRRLLTLVSVIVTVATFGLLALYKGNTETVTAIIDSWSRLTGGPMITGTYNSVGAIGWDTTYAVNHHLHMNFTCRDFKWFGIVYQPIVMVIVYYIAMNFTAIFTDDKHLAASRRLALSSIYGFSFICLLPMFAFLSCDYGRLYQYLMVMTYAVVLILPVQNILSLFPQWYLKAVNRLNHTLNRIVVPSRGLMILLLLLFAVCPYEFNPAGAIRMSVIFTDFHWAAEMLHALRDML